MVFWKKLLKRGYNVYIQLFCFKKKLKTVKDNIKENTHE